MKQTKLVRSTYSLKLHIVSIKHRFLQLLPKHGDHLPEHFQVHCVILYKAAIAAKITLDDDLVRNFSVIYLIPLRPPLQLSSPSFLSYLCSPFLQYRADSKEGNDLSKATTERQKRLAVTFLRRVNKKSTNKPRGVFQSLLLLQCNRCTKESYYHLSITRRKL